MTRYYAVGTPMTIEERSFNGVLSGNFFARQFRSLDPETVQQEAFKDGSTISTTDYNEAVSQARALSNRGTYQFNEFNKTSPLNHSKSANRALLA